MEYIEFRSGSELAKTTIIMLGIVASLGILFASLQAAELYFPPGLDSAGAPDPSVFNVVVGLAGLIVMLLNLATQIVFLVWNYRVSSNLLALNRNATTISPGWAVGWWFVPFASLIMPFRCINEILNGSKPENALNSYYVADNSSSNLSSLWWLSWIGSGLVGLFAAILMSNPIEETSEIYGRLILLAVSEGLALAAAFMAMKIIRQIDENQEESFRSLGNRSEYYSPPPPPTNFY